MPQTDTTTGYGSLATLNDSGNCTLSVMVRGIHCAACIQKIENTLKAEHDVVHARLNFSTGRLALEWRGEAARADRFIQKIEHMGYDVYPFDADREEHAVKQEERFLLLCLGVAGFAMGNIMLLSIGLWITTSETMGMAMREFMHWISAVIALPTILFSGRPFFRSAFKSLSKGQTNMDVPITIALLLVGGMSLLGTITHSEHVYFDSAVMLIFFLLIGRYLDFRARKIARSAATDLLNTLSGFALVVENGQTRRIAVQDLKEGMIVRLASGEKCPIDGTVSTGISEVDTSLITGETLPHPVKAGDMMYAGTLNMSAPLEIKVTTKSDDTLLADIVRLMEQAEQAQAKYVRIADRAAQLYTPVIHGLAALAFLYWLFIGGSPWQDALMISITVLIITCPCALGLAVPVVQVLATSKLMKQNVLVKSGDALERLAAIDTVIFDKTGTLTLGKPTLKGGTYTPENLELAAALAAHSQHPLSKALRETNCESKYEFEAVQEHPGQGLSAKWDDKLIKLGSRNWAGNPDAPPSDHMELWLNLDGTPLCVFHFKDQLKDDAAHTIDLISQAVEHIYILSGDRTSVVQKIARILGIEHAYGELTPPEKYAYLDELKNDGHKVLMVGDGLNDTPVLSGADVSMAPGSALDLAKNAADIVFQGNKLAPVHNAFQTARLTQKLIKQNFALAIIYNCLAIPFALTGLVTPLFAALAMSGSSLLVIANSFRCLGSGLINYD
jgi:Cu2+-exporting ATPase